MAKKRLQRPKDELKRELVEQLTLLRNACQGFDEGFEALGKHIALVLRVLVHEHGQSRALLAQLNIRPARFVDSAGPLNPRNVLSECNLVMQKFGASGGQYLPVMDPPIPMRPIPFADWWNNPVLKDKGGRAFSRGELVLHVCDTDGGAHVDPELDEAYMALSRANSLGWQFSNGSIVKALNGRPELACMRQIAHEVLTTICQFVPEFSAHAQPVIPKR
ncbi:MAG TPA: hypothetical protein VEG08_08325 [Terriglobales bacterium]|nr:hypothetical protein [Terriglobales bacterium]